MTILIMELCTMQDREKSREQLILEVEYLRKQIQEKEKNAGERAQTFEENRRNIIGRRYADKEVHKSQRNLQSLFNSLDDFLFVLDMEGNIIQVNPVVQERLGYSAEELAGASILKVHPSDRREEAVAIIIDMLAGNSAPCNIPLMAKGGNLIPVETKFIQGMWDDRDVLFGISRDVTERKRAESERERLIAELQKALDEIKTLKGYIPICSYCKKIRDDKGYWEQLEKYISEHTEALFSHGICPDCIKTYFPEIPEVHQGE
jgi:PAS domain S-box-containing protein